MMLMRMLGYGKSKPNSTPEILQQAPPLPLEQKPSGNAKSEWIQRCFPLLKSNAFAPDVKPDEVLPVERSLEQLVAAGKQLCEEWGIRYIRGVENKDVWCKLITDRDSEAQSKKYYQAIQNNLAIALDYLQDNRILLSIRKKELDELLEALSVCPGGIYDRLESLAISKKTCVTLAALLSAFRLEIVEGVAMEACKYYSNATYNVYKTSYSPHMRILFKQYASDEDLNLPLTGDMAAVDDLYHQGIMHKWFFTNDKTNPRDYFNQQFTAHYSPLNIVNRLVEQLVDAIKNTFLDEPQLRSAADAPSFERTKPYVYATPAATGGYNLHYCVTINNNTVIVALEKKNLLDLYESIKQKAINYVLDNSITLTDVEKKAILNVVVINNHTQNLARFDFSERADYTRFTLFQNKCKSLPLIMEYPDKWHLFYNEERDEEDVVPKGYRVKSHADLRIAIMQLFGEQLFETVHIKQDSTHYILLQGCPELSYYIDALNDVKPLQGISEINKIAFLDAISFETLQRLKLTGLVPLSPSVFIHVLGKNHLDFSSAIIQNIDFTVEPFCNLAIDCLCFEKSSVTFENVQLSAQQWSTLNDAGRTEFTGITCLDYQPLSDAIKANDSQLALYLISAGVDVNYKDTNNSMLWLAIKNNLAVVVNTLLTGNLDENTLQDSILGLLDQKPQPFYQTTLPIMLGHDALKKLTYRYVNSGNNALHLAVLNGYHDLIPLLCQKGVDILFKNKKDESPLDLAMNAASVGLVEMILIHSSMEIDLNLKNTLLCKALKVKNSGLASYLLLKGADANYKDTNNSMLWLAIKYNLAEVVNTLLTGNLDENTLQDSILGLLDQKPQPFYQTILPIMLGHDALKKLTYRYVNSGNNALHLAVLNGYHDLIPLLCQKGVDILFKNKKDESPLDLAMNAASVGLVEMILIHSSMEIDLNLKNTLLCKALKVKNSGLASYLLLKGADANYKDTNNSMLWLAIKNNLAEVVNTLLTGNLEENTLQDSILGLLDQKPQPFYQTILPIMLRHDALKKLTYRYVNSGNNTLHLAVLNGYHDLIPLLCQKGVDILFKNKKDESPLDLAMNAASVGLVEMILIHSSMEIDLNLKNTLLCKALKVKNSGLALYLLTAGADLNFVDNQNTMLGLAIENNLDRVVDAILKGKVNEVSLWQAILFFLNKKAISGSEQATLIEMINNPALKKGSNACFSDTGNGALHLAIINEHQYLIPLLCQKGADILLKNKEGLSPLDLAINVHHVALGEAILETSSMVIDHHLKNTLLCKALKAKNCSFALYLLTKGADLNFIDDGIPMLLLALKNRLVNVVDEMLTRFVVEEITLQQSILFAINQPNIEGLYATVLRKMLGHKALQNAVCLLGANEDTALHIAVRNRHTEMIALLCKKNADILAKNQAGQSPLGLALSMNQFYDVEAMVIESTSQIVRMNIDIKNKLLVKAIQIKRNHLALFLLHNGADINFSDGYSMLWHAIKNNLPMVAHAMLKGDIKKNTLIECLQLLLQQTALEAIDDVNLGKILHHNLLKTSHDQRSINGLSWALHAAITNGHHTAIRLLCQNGANVFMKNKLGECVLDLVLDNNAIETFNSILECSLISSVRKDDIFEFVSNLISVRLSYENNDHIIEIVSAVIQKFILSPVSNQTEKAYLTLLKDTVFKYVNVKHSLFFITLDNKVQNYLLIVNCIRRACNDTEPDLGIMLEGTKEIKAHYEYEYGGIIYGQFFSPNPLWVSLQKVIEEGETMLANKNNQQMLAIK